MPIAEVLSNSIGTVGSGTLAADPGTGGTTITVTTGHGARFPAVASGTQQMHLTIDNEIMRVTAHTASADTFTVVRAQGGTTAAAHAISAAVYAALSEEALENFVGQNGPLSWRNILRAPYNCPTDGTTNVSGIFQQACDEASADFLTTTVGNTVVWVPKGVYRVNQVELKTGVTMLVEGGTVFKLPTVDVTYNSRVHPGYVTNSSVNSQFFVLGTPYTQWTSTDHHSNVSFIGFGGLVSFDATQMGTNQSQGWSVHGIGVYNVNDWEVRNVDATYLPWGATLFPATNGGFISSLEGRVDNIRLSGYGPDEQQTLTFGGTITGGTFTLNFGGQVTTAITYSAVTATLATNIQTALRALGYIGTEGVVVTGAGLVQTVRFTSNMGGRNMPQLVAVSSLTGTAPTITPATSVAGVVAGFGPIQWTGGKRAHISRVYAVDWCPVSFEMDASSTAIAEDILVEDIGVWRQPATASLGFEYICKFLAGRIVGQENNQIRRITIRRAYGQNVGAFQMSGVGTVQDVTIEDLVCEGNGFPPNLILMNETWVDGGNLLFVNPKLTGASGDGIFLNKANVSSLEMYSPTITGCTGNAVNVITGSTMRFSGRTVLTPNTGGKKTGAGTLIYPQEAYQTIAYAATITPDPYLGQFIAVGTLTGNIAINVPTVAVHPGAEMTFYFIKDATVTARTVTFNTVFRKNIAFPTTTSGARMTVTFVYTGSEWVQTATVINQV